MTGVSYSSGMGLTTISGPFGAVIGGGDKVIRVGDLTVRPARNPTTGK